jgi:hypothetical protein
VFRDGDLTLNQEGAWGDPFYVPSQGDVAHLVEDEPIRLLVPASPKAGGGR